MKTTAPVQIGIASGPYNQKGFARYGEEKFLKLKQFGYNGVDYNVANTDVELYSMDEDALKEKLFAEKEAARLAGIQISQIHGPWRYPPQDSTEQDRQERLEKMKKAVIICKLLGCRHLVIHPIMPFGINDLEQSEATWALNFHFFKDLVAFAKQHQVIICMENMPMTRFSLATPERVLAFVKEFNDAHLQICLDTGHVATFADLSLGNEVRRLGKWIKALHIHDNMGDRDSHSFPGDGIIDWVDFMRAIREIEFQGVLSLETAPSGNLDDLTFEAESIRLCELLKKYAAE